MTTSTKKTLTRTTNSTQSIQSTNNGLAIMLIDMQRDFVPKKLFPEDEQALYESHSKIIQELCINRNIPLINVLYAGSGPVVPNTKKYLDMCKILKTHIKSSPNAFESGSRLYSNLKQMQIDTLFIMGVNASACVYDSAISATKDKGFKVITADDVIADCIRIQLRTKDKRKKEFINNNIIYHDSYKTFLDNYLKS
jgi:nicotinamidase-related amidase